MNNKVVTFGEIMLRLSSDIIFRKNPFQYGKSAQEMMPELITGCDLIVANKQNAQEILNIGSDDMEETHIYEQIMERFPNIKKIASTKRESISASHNRLSGVLYNGVKMIHTHKYDKSHC